MPRKMRKPINTAKLRNQLAILIAMREAKDRRKYTRQEVAEAAGVSINAVQAMINNQTDQYDGEVVVKLCEWLGVTPAVFFGSAEEGFSIPQSVNASFVAAMGFGG